MTSRSKLLGTLCAGLFALALTSCKATPPPELAAPVPAPKKAVTTAAADEQKPAPKKARALKLGIAIPSYVHAVAWIADEMKIFAAHGIDAEVVTMGGSAATMKGLVSGDIKIGLAGGDAAIKANLVGADLVVFGTVVNRHYHRLVVKDDIKTPEDLKGRTIGLPFLGGPQDFLVYVLCKKWGIRYGDDVKIQHMGREFARLVAITEGKVDGITSAAPKSTLDKLGLHVLADPRDWKERAPYMMLVAQRSFLKENEALVLDFLRALADAQELYLSKPDEALTVAFNKLGAKKGDAKQNYLEGGPALYVIPPEPDRQAMGLALGYIKENPDFADKASGFDLERMLDGALVKRLTAEGAYKKASAAKHKLAADLAAARSARAGAIPGDK